MRLHPDEYADLRRTQPQPRPMNPWLFGAIGIGAATVAIALMAWVIPAAIRFVVSLLAVDLAL